MQCKSGAEVQSQESQLTNGGRRAPAWARSSSLPASFDSIALSFPKAPTAPRRVANYQPTSLTAAREDTLENTYQIKVVPY